MKKKIVQDGIVVAITLVIIGSGIRFMAGRAGKHGFPEKNIRSDQAVSAEAVAAAPGRYKGFLEVAGLVTGIGKAGDVFFLGCEDGCMFVPVKYSGNMPAPGSRLIVYGEMKQQGDKYVFEGKEIRVR